MKRLEHREACYELRRSARLLATGKLTLPAWEASVNRILDARDLSDHARAGAPNGARP